MDGLFGLPAEFSDKPLMSPLQSMLLPLDYHSFLDHRIPSFGSDELISSEEASDITPENSSSLIKAKIASHPCYPRLLDAYIDCQKVGAPPAIACLLDEIRLRNDLCKPEAVSACLGADPELDEFMKTYCDVLVKYKSDLERPFTEATTFLNEIEMQLRSLCIGVSIGTLSDEGAISSDEELSGGEVEVHEGQSNGEDQNLKGKLLRKFGTHINSLKLEFSKKKKKGKLPKEARQTLLEWWNIHYKWPYPTEADKVALAESSGLDQKQINNWFINQRKRHWKPSENMQFAVMGNLSGQFLTNDWEYNVHSPI
ncbi:hypothetical protein K2173_005812 [Erythroxylum novogranatense]|uniref:Homeobox protein knotted-1-like 6 n=1 Tax=Erythroxylum novogranatense TaxID=1862640 RepID=A0AAV8U423_9ROSI|nr:hypothetical protein K2173_005812 [Erythroxylum novogranatense]